MHLQTVSKLDWVVALVDSNALGAFKEAIHEVIVMLLDANGTHAY